MRVHLVLLLITAFFNISIAQDIAPNLESSAVVVKDSAQQYFILSSLPVNHLKSGEIVAVPFPGQSQIVDATVVAGKLPEGTMLYPNGLLVVSNSKSVGKGSYQFTIETTHADNQVQKHDIDWKVTDAVGTDRDAIFFVTNKKNVNEYVEGEMLAHAHDPDGNIIDATLVKGKLPQGSMLTDKGNVVIGDKAQLEVGNYNAWIVTTDSQRGISLFVLTLILEDSPVADN